MWYLVIPPIIVVLSLAFLLWYLSRKRTDPFILEKISQTEVTAPSFSRTKEFFLRMLEKWAQRFKVASLRTHNSLHDFTQTVKERRRKIHQDIPVAEKEAAFSKEISLSSSGDEGFFSRFVRTAKTKNNPPSVSISTIEKRNEERQALPVSIMKEQKEESVPRPMVSETVAEPDLGKRRVKANVPREETLIARIAVNPKDFTAYEELGDYYLQIENIKDAKECYRQVLKLSPVQRMVKIKIRRLEKLLTRDGE